MSMYVSLHHNEPLDVSAFAYGDSVALKFATIGYPVAEVTISDETPESLIALGEKIIAEGQRLLQEKTKALMPDMVLASAG